MGPQIYNKALAADALQVQSAILGVQNMAQAKGAMKYSERVETLIADLTLEEKITLLAAKNIWETPEIDRLGIPSLKVSASPLLRSEV